MEQLFTCKEKSHDTSAIAKVYGGGGSPSSSSFIITMDEYNQWISGIKGEGNISGVVNIRFWGLKLKLFEELTGNEFELWEREKIQKKSQKFYPIHMDDE
ncbi:hypothetical protein L1987_02452 [Smallanthus sonchifolius]|uniref:Uncharacterized protein n=1 Tax=Smallanthus sonchifolius TaxID=185202 RepID=A0ACB9K7V2_9ASTR|nr:hypothetical protein L1987_02452 [Smallanthus sonchifolius]